MALSEEQINDLFVCHDSLKEQRALYDLEWDDILRLMLPGASDILNQRMPGQTRLEHMYDTTALMSLHTLAANIQGSVTNQAMEWQRYRFRNEELNAVGGVAKWLEPVNAVTMAAYNASNFYQAAHTYYMNLAAFGTAAMFVGQQEVMPANSVASLVLRFKTLATGSYCIAENADGVIDTLYRILYYTPHQAYQLFGDDISKKMHELMANPQEKHKPQAFLHAVYPRRSRDPRRLDNRNMPWASVYVECETREVVRETGYHEFPFVVSRWETLDQSPWGFGPGHMALPEVRTLNKLKEMHLLQLVLWVQPPLMALQQGVIGGISLEPLAVNIVTAMDALKPLDLTGRPDLVQIDQAQLRQSIQDIFFVNALQGLPPPEVAKMTATEVAHRIEQMQRLMGPAFLRLTHEMLNPLADRVFGMLMRASQPYWARGQDGLFPQMPRAVVQAAMANQGQLDVEYEGPLARAQRGADVRAVHETLAVVERLVALSQDMSVFDLLNMDEIMRGTAKATGLPMHFLRDMVQVGQMRKARETLQAQQLASQELREDATALGKVAPVLKQLPEFEYANAA